MISAKIVADSLNEFGHRLTTFELVYPRIIHGELMTHRVFSRNSASSRAIPFAKMAEAVKTNPFIPIAFLREHKGMQGTEYLTGDFEINEARATWLIARDKAVHEATNLTRIGVTKQLANRLLEPFMWHKVLVTSSELQNFFKLRTPKYVFETPVTKTIKTYSSKKEVLANRHQHWDIDMKGSFDDYSTLDWLKINTSQAEIHIQALAEAVLEAYGASVPKQLKGGEWHIPYGENINYIKMGYDKDVQDFTVQTVQLDLIKIATARAARVSYTVVGEEKAIDYEKDIKLHDSLLSSGHMSPLEHCAKAMTQEELDNYLIIEDGLTIPGRCRNFTGFIQYRAMVEKIF